MTVATRNKARILIEKENLQALEKKVRNSIQ
jgi:hypothetical protein